MIKSIVPIESLDGFQLNLTTFLPIKWHAYDLGGLPVLNFKQIYVARNLRYNKNILRSRIENNSKQRDPTARRDLQFIFNTDLHYNGV